jgi:hypothetical protein
MKDQQVLGELQYQPVSVSHQPQWRPGEPFCDERSTSTRWASVSTSLSFSSTSPEVRWPLLWNELSEDRLSFTKSTSLFYHPPNYRPGEHCLLAPWRWMSLNLTEGKLSPFLVFPERKLDELRRQPQPQFTIKPQLSSDGPLCEASTTENRLVSESNRISKVRWTYLSVNQHQLITIIRDLQQASASIFIAFLVFLLSLGKHLLAPTRFRALKISMKAFWLTILTFL